MTKLELIVITLGAVRLETLPLRTRLGTGVSFFLLVLKYM